MKTKPALFGQLPLRYQVFLKEKTCTKIIFLCIICAAYPHHLVMWPLGLSREAQYHDFFVFMTDAHIRQKERISLQSVQPT